MTVHTASQCNLRVADQTPRDWRYLPRELSPQLVRSLRGVVERPVLRANGCGLSSILLLYEGKLWGLRLRSCSPRLTADQRHPRCSGPFTLAPDDTSGIGIFANCLACCWFKTPGGSALTDIGIEIENLATTLQTGQVRFYWSPNVFFPCLGPDRGLKPPHAFISLFPIPPFTDREVFGFAFSLCSEP